MVKDQPFIPIAWQKDHSGMQGTEYFTEDDVESTWLQEKWLEARDHAVLAAQKLHHIGLTKQLCNRLLEPFMYHTVLVTATEWDNFFALRHDPMAEIHIADLAEKMLVAYNESEPLLLKPGEWHIPFGDKLDDEKVRDYLRTVDADFNHKCEPFSIWSAKQQQVAIKIAVARCARLSYETLGDNPKIDYAADIRLHDQLLAGGHMSPFEHVARAMTEDEFDSYVSGRLIEVERTVEGEWYMATEATDESLGWCGNFRGFIQYRKELPNENRQDSRVIKK